VGEGLPRVTVIGGAFPSEYLALVSREKELGFRPHTEGITHRGITQVDLTAYRTGSSLINREKQPYQENAKGLEADLGKSFCHKLKKKMKVELYASKLHDFSQKYKLLRRFFCVFSK
jgi:hypothetical protein